MTVRGCPVAEASFLLAPWPSLSAFQLLPPTQSLLFLFLPAFCLGTAFLRGTLKLPKMCYY